MSATTGLLETLRVLAEALPPGSVVPVPREALLELVAASAQGPGTDRDHVVPPVDLTVMDVALRYGRHASTVRAWLERGLFPGAYRLHHREWRVPRTALVAFETHARESSPSTAARKEKAVNLAAWRTAS
jgi:hypothetical protein